jgi:hypothetical protein
MAVQGLSRPARERGGASSPCRRGYGKMFSIKPLYWQLIIEHCSLSSVETACGGVFSANQWTMLNSQFSMAEGGFLNFLYDDWRLQPGTRHL